MDTTFNQLPISPLDFSGLSCHSQSVRPGNLFFAIKGRQTDGAEFIEDALAHGAAAVVHQVPLPVGLPVPTYQVNNIRLVMAMAASEFYHHPSHVLKITGITGSNGKTTTAAMLDEILKAGSCPTGFIGTTAVKIGNNSVPAALTTPDSVSLQYYFAQMNAVGVRHVTMEVSAQGIEMERVAGTKFTLGIFTNICPEHLDFYTNFTEYIQSKKRFFTLLGKKTPVIINIDDDVCKEMISLAQGDIITVSLKQPALITASGIKLFASGSSFKVDTPKYSFTVALNIPGRHNIYNAICAIAAALHYGISPKIIRTALARFTPVERRMQIYKIGRLSVLDDTALNPGSINAIFETLPIISPAKITVVFAIRGGRGPAINRLNAECLSYWARRLKFNLITTSSLSHSPISDKVGPADEHAFRQSLAVAQVKYSHFVELPDALTYAITCSPSDGFMVLLGAQGMDAGKQLLNHIAFQEDYIRHLRNILDTQTVSGFSGA